MARYRKVDSRIWNDAKFSSLSDNGKLVFFMLLTHPSMTALGAMRGNIPGLASEMGWKVEAFREAFREALSKGMAEHDEKSSFISLPRFLKYNAPESPNVVKAWESCLDLLPECDLKNVVLCRAKGYAEALTKGFAQALPEAFSKAMPIQEQEQEQEPEQEHVVQKKQRAGVKTKPGEEFPIFPDWVPLDAWYGYTSMRDKIKKPMTAYAARLVLKELTRLRGDGHQPACVLEQSIKNNWTDVYAVKQKFNGASNGNIQASPRLSLADQSNARTVARDSAAFVIDDARPILVENAGAIRPYVGEPVRD